MADSQEHVLSKVEKNVALHHETFLVMFYRQQQRSLWYHFSNFKHFLRLRAELLMISVAPSWLAVSLNLELTQFPWTAKSHGQFH